jgi:anti-sigma-K factor RskA
MSEASEDRDLLAATYVLGALEADEAHAVEMLAEQDHAVADSIEAWRYRLAPLADAVLPVPPPAVVWQRLEATLGLPVAVAPQLAAAVVAEQPRLALRLWRDPRFWRSTTAAALALAAALAGVAYLGRSVATEYAAALAPPDAPPPAFIASLEADGALLVRPLARVPVQPGKDLELWALPEGAQKPVSLGVLPSTGRRLTRRGVPASGTQLMVSLEPLGGSPTGTPTGPVLYSGTLARLD